MHKSKLLQYYHLRLGKRTGKQTMYRMSVPTLSQTQQSNPERNPGNVQILTLKEEIKTFLDMDMEGEYDTIYQTNEILKLFIEKIDIKLRNVESEESEYWIGYLEALRELKQDLEK